MSSSVAIVIGILVILPCYIAEAVLYKPPVINNPIKPTTKYISAGTNSTINCTAEGTAPITYRWTFNGADITSLSPISFDPNTGQLTVKEFTTREEGDYQCFATNSITPSISPVAVSPVVTLIQVKLAPNWPETPEETITKNVGDYAALKCTNVPDSVPAATFSWYIVSSGTKEEVKTKEDDRKYLDDEGTLHFAYLEKSDEQTSPDKYECAIYNSDENTIRLGSSKILRVNTKAKSQVKPLNVFKTSNMNFLRTQSAELECVFSGHPLPTVKWFDKQRNEIFHGSKYEFVPDTGNRKLLIKNLVDADEGLYICQGENSVGKVDETVYLDVTSGPIWTGGLSYKTLPEGRDAQFTCQARASAGEDQLTDPVWFKNGKEINMASPDVNIQFSEKGTALTVLQIRKPFDIMCLQCKVSNKVSSEFDNACLNVINPIVVENPPPSQQEIEKGDPVDLTVVGTTDPALTLKYRWHFRNQTYETSLPPFVTYDDVTKTTYINTTQMTDEEFRTIEGVYIRELYHQYEKKNVSIEVILKGHIIPVPVVEAGFPWWVIVLVILLLLIIAIVIIVLCCCRNKEQGAYRIYKTELNAAYLNPDKDLEDNKFHDVARIGDEEDPKAPLKLGPSYDLSGDEGDSLDEYKGGKLLATSFTEDGSFIGMYASRESQDF